MAAKTQTRSKKIITIIVLSCDKQDYLRRIIWLYRSFDCHLIFADGSKNDWDSGDSGEFGNLTWEYFRTSSRKRTFKNYTERFIESIKLVTSPYTVFMDDEEFLFPSGIQAAIKFLEKNPSRSAAGGQIYILDTKNKYKLGTWGRKSTEFELSLNNGIGRISKLVSHQRTANLMYQVVPTELYQKFAKILTKSSFSSKIQFHSALEIFQSIFLAQHGKWKMQSYPYWIRIPGPINEGQSKSLFLTQSEIQIISENLFRRNTKNYSSLQAIMNNCWGQNSIYHQESKFRLLENPRQEKTLLHDLKRLIKRYYFTGNEKKLNHVSTKEFQVFKQVIRNYPSGMSKKEFNSLTII